MAIFSVLFRSKTRRTFFVLLVVKSLSGSVLRLQRLSFIAGFGRRWRRRLMANAIGCHVLGRRDGKTCVLLGCLRLKPTKRFLQNTLLFPFRILK
jgi:hypothetical protein